MKRVSLYVVMAGLMLSGSVFAATLDNFKEAVDKKGCESIPFESIRRTCADKGRDVDDWCKNSSREISCDDLDPSGISNKIENVKRKIADIKRERDELSSKVSGAKDDSERRDLEDKRRRRRLRSTNLKRKTAIHDRIYNGERCVGFREDVARSFADAKSSAKSESDPEIKPYADRLIAKWEAGEPGHATAIRNFKEAVESSQGSGCAFVTGRSSCSSAGSARRL